MAPAPPIDSRRFRRAKPTKPTNRTAMNAYALDARTPDRIHIKLASATLPALPAAPLSIYGLSSVPRDADALAVLWLLHPRLNDASSMEKVARDLIDGWEARRQRTQSGSKTALIAVSFDQRNHGSRLEKPLANEAWRQGNPTHAPDMWDTYAGTASDLSALVAALPGYLQSEQRDLPPVRKNIVLGVSLGAHAAWHALLHDKSVDAGVIIIGCPDFARLMAQRASLSKLPEWKDTSHNAPAGSAFFNSSKFSRELLAAVEDRDPAGYLLPARLRAQNMKPLEVPTAARDVAPASALERKLLAERLDATLSGKAVLALSGGKDKLVPTSVGRTFVEFLKGAIGGDSAEGGKSKQGWWADGAEKLWFSDVVEAGAGHECTVEMVGRAGEFIAGVLEGRIRTGSVEGAELVKGKL